MATLIPSFNQCATRMTGGERRFAQRVIDKLEDDYLCWFDVPVGSRSLHPDFVILHPRRGLLILEVKDWKPNLIKSAHKASFTLITDKGVKTKPNPFEQARQYAHAIVDTLERDPLLRVPAGTQFQGRLCFPYGYGVVFSNIHRKTFEEAELGEVIEPDRVICQDEMFETVDPEAFQERLWKMFTVKFKTVMSLPQIDRVRWHLFPEIRIRPNQLSMIDEPGKEQAVAESVPDLIRVMDLQQEQLARNLGEGHRVIHGVAGSGKTLILGFRCERLAPALAKPILVLCFNAALASKLQDWVNGKGLDGKVNVRTLHAWCRDQLVLYNVALPESGKMFYDEVVARVVGAVERGLIPAAQYGAVMVDEGHDFKPEWLRLVAQMVDPSTDSLLVLYDDAQSIYGDAKKRKFSFSSVGIHAQGRTTILKVNYRNTAEVLSVAYEFAKEVMTPVEAGEDDVPLVEPRSAGRRGPMPVLNQLASLQEEGDYIARVLIAANRKGRPWRDMAVLYRARFIAEEIAPRLRKARIPVQWLGDPNEKRKFQPSEDSVKLMTMHSSKGLEFSVVAIPGIGFMPMKEMDAREEAKLLYVAMTRAMHFLLLTSHRESNFVARLKEARAKTPEMRAQPSLGGNAVTAGSDPGLEDLLRYSPLDDE
jgi:UvrD-like helicase C-terminal domain/Nuclease-related domain/AAA domain